MRRCLPHCGPRAQNEASRFGTIAPSELDFACRCRGAGAPNQSALRRARRPRLCEQITAAALAQLGGPCGLATAFLARAALEPIRCMRWGGGPMQSPGVATDGSSSMSSTKGPSRGLQQRAAMANHPPPIRHREHHTPVGAHESHETSTLCSATPVCKTGRRAAPCDQGKTLHGAPPPTPTPPRPHTPTRQNDRRYGLRANCFAPQQGSLCTTLLNHRPMNIIVPGRSRRLFRRGPRCSSDLRAISVRDRIWGTYSCQDATQSIHLVNPTGGSHSLAPQSRRAARAKWRAQTTHFGDRAATAQLTWQLWV